jgi:hypothetical protein
MAHVADSIYTPSWVAEEIVAGLRLEGDVLAIDPAMGGGALLRALEKAYPTAQLFGLDCDPAAVRMARSRASWQTGRCDFLDRRSRAASPVLSAAVKNGLNCVVLNPPFSCRGARRVTAQIPVSGEWVASSLAMAFLLHAIWLLEPGGVVGVVMPRGSLTAAKDKEAWRLVHRTCLVETQRVLNREAFGGHYASTAVLRVEVQERVWSREHDASAGEMTPSHSLPRVIRGWVQMPSRKQRSGKRVPLIHTTDLRELKNSALRTVRSTRTCCGPVVLLPRVGKASPDHVAVYVEPRAVALSDCLLAVPCADVGSARLLREQLRERWADLSARYGGSCAPYLTVEQLRSHLAWLASRVRPVDGQGEFAIA